MAAEITAQMIKDLRERTGAGMADCKKALTECAADMEKAIEYLRKKGIASAAKKATRIAVRGDGRAATCTARASACMVEVNCETDFVARNPDFVSFAQGDRDAGGGDQPAVRLAGRDPAPPCSRRRSAIRIEQAKQSGKPEAVIREDRRRPDRQVGQGDLPPRSGVGEGSRGQEGHPRAAHRSRRQDRRERPASAASSASRSARAWRSAPTTSSPRSRSRPARRRVDDGADATRARGRTTGHSGASTARAEQNGDTAARRPAARAAVRAPTSRRQARRSRRG